MKSAFSYLLALACLAAGTAGVRAQTEKMNTNQTNRLETATFGGGCFWCMEAVFEKLKGVTNVVSGYSGGAVPSPSYEDVCSGATGHAEVIQVEYNPAQITYDQLLEIFWQAHDPTTMNSQGADHGTQYRSVILYHNDAQKLAAEKSKTVAAKNFPQPIVTQIVPLAKFYVAEDYHQDYFRKHPNKPYCAVVIAPKLQKLFKKPLP